MPDGRALGQSSGMGFRIVAEGTMTVHFLVLAFLVVGGFVAWRWRWGVWPHLALAGRPTASRACSPMASRTFCTVAPRRHQFLTSVSSWPTGTISSVLAW